MAKNTDFCISMTGAQEKACLLRYKNKWCKPIGITPTTHIVKLPIDQIEHNGINLSKSIEKVDPLLFHLHGKPALIATGTSPP